jgi:hypothetical protein
VVPTPAEDASQRCPECTIREKFPPARAFVLEHDRAD